jgi:hypothetical protein
MDVGDSGVDSKILLTIEGVNKTYRKKIKPLPGTARCREYFSMKKPPSV